MCRDLCVLFFVYCFLCRCVEICVKMWEKVCFCVYFLDVFVSVLSSLFFENYDLPKKEYIAFLGNKVNSLKT